MRFAILFLLAAVVARADSLTELKTALATAEGSGTLRATVTLASSRESDGKRDEAPSEALVTAEMGSDGLVLHWPRAVVDQALQEGKSRDGKKSGAKSTRSAMGGLGVVAVAEILDAAPSVLRSLEHAELVEEKSTEWQGRPARLLTLKIDPALGEKERKFVKEISVSAKVWIDAHGWPLAAEKTLDMKGRAMLVISFEQHEKEELRFARVGGRLVTIYHLKDATGSGAGESGRQHQLTTVDIEES